MALKKEEKETINYIKYSQAARSQYGVYGYYLQNQASAILENDVQLSGAEYTFSQTNAKLEANRQALAKNNAAFEGTSKAFEGTSKALSGAQKSINKAYKALQRAGASNPSRQKKRTGERTKSFQSGALGQNNQSFF